MRSPRIHGHVLALAIACAAACSDSPAAGTDAGLPDAAPGITPPTPPAPPATPVLTPCPAGWNEVTEGDVTTCEPWPAGGPVDCAADEAHFPGEPGCARLGPACPADGWPADLPPGKPVLWVRAGSAPGGTGTQASPFATIGAAEAAAVPGTVIAVASGLYQEGFVVDTAGVVVQGACVAGTRIVPAIASETAGTIHVREPAVELRNLTVGGPRMGILVFPSGDVHADGVAIDSSEGIAIRVDGGSFTGTNLVVRDTAGRPSDGRYGRGVDVEYGGQVVLTRAALERNRDVAVLAYDVDSTVTLTDVVVRDTQSEGGAALVGGRAINVQSGARVEATRSVFERSREIGVFAALPGSTVVLTDVVVRDTLPQESDRRYGRGVQVQSEARVEGTRVLFERNRDVGAGAEGPGTTVLLTDVVVRDTLAQESDGRFGRALNAQFGPRIEVTRGVIERAHEVAVFAGGDDSLVALTDTVVRDTLSQESDQGWGRGLSVEYAGRVEVTRAVFERNRDAAIRAHGDGTTAVLTDVVVRDTLSQEVDQRLGRGLVAQLGARVDVERALFERNRDVGVLAASPGTRVFATDLSVLDTLDQDCTVAATCEWSHTSHIGSYDGASVEVSRFALRRSAFLGVQVAPVPMALGGANVGATIDLHEGVVADNPIGINIQSDGFDLARIRDRVTWGPNVVNLVTDTLPVPGSGAPGGP